MCTGVVLPLTLDVSGISWKKLFVHRRGRPALFGVFLEHLGKHLLCTGAVPPPPPLTLGCFRNILEGFSLRCFWNSLERIFVRRRSTPAPFVVFLEHLGRQLVCTGAAMSATTSGIFFCCAQARCPGALWGVSGTSWKQCSCTSVVFLPTSQLLCTGAVILLCGTSVI